MKKLFNKLLICLIVSVICLPIFTGCASATDSVVRIHIRANSNSNFDQSVKLKVRDKIVEYITTKIDGCESCDAVKSVLNDNLDNIEKISDSVLIENGCDYVSTASINNEFFPSRDYDGVCFPADYYDALIIRLGSAVGDNWWCVAYPPLCFVDNSSDKIEYKSKLVEIINKLFK